MLATWFLGGDKGCGSLGNVTHLTLAFGCFSNCSARLHCCHARCRRGRALGGCSAYLGGHGEGRMQAYRWGTVAEVRWGAGFYDVM